MYFQNYWLQQTCLNKCLKSAVSLYPSTSNNVNRPKNFSNRNDVTFSIFIVNCAVNWVWKVLTLFVNTFTADDKYSLLDRDNLTQPFQMQLSQKKNFFPNFLLKIWKIDEIFNTFKKKMTLIANVFPNLQTPKNVVR